MNKQPEWTPALTAAVINTELAGTKPVEGFSRDHVRALHNAGCNKAQVREYLLSVFGAQTFRPHSGEAVTVSLVDHIMSDLDSYGMWKQ